MNGTAPPFRLLLLGDPSLVGPDGPLAGRAVHRRRIALLAVLALARGRPVGRERLLALLWPEHAPDAARHNLSEALYVVRRELGAGALASTATDVALVGTMVGCDAVSFEDALDAGELEEASALYTGALLDGFHVADAPEFERWVDGERERLAQRFARAVETLAERAEAAGSALRAVDAWRRLAAHDRFSSRVALRLIRALDAAGERGAALRHAEAHAALLRDELGFARDAELEAVVARLRSDPLRTPPPPEPPGFAVGAERGASIPGAPPEAPSPAPRPTPGPRHARPPHRRRTAALLGVAALAVAAAWLGGAPPGPADADDGGHDPRRIAVLYFDDHSPDQALRHLASGLTESLIHELGQVTALDVVSRNGVKPYRDRPVPWDSLVAELRVGSVVEGSLQRGGDTLYVTVQLIDAATGGHLDSRVVAHPLGEVVALQREVAEEVGAALRRRLGRELRLRDARAGTRSDEALALTFRAEEAYGDAIGMDEMDPADAESARRLLHLADTLLAGAERADPAWTRPALARARIAARLAQRETGTRRDSLLDAALRRAERVLAREPGKAEALELRGTLLLAEGVRGAGGGRAPGERLDRAERDLRAAVAAAPGRAGGWRALSQLLRYRGRFAEAHLAARRALAEDAYLEGAAEVMQALYSSALALGDHAEAAHWCERGGARFPEDWRLVECRLTRMREDPAYPQDPGAAWALVETLDRLDPPGRARAEGRAYTPLHRRMVAASVSARAGDAQRARAEIARARREVAGEADLRLSLAYDEAYVRLALGEADAARRLLDELVAARPALADFVRRDPLFRALFTPAPLPAPPGTG